MANKGKFIQNVKGPLLWSLDKLLKSDIKKKFEEDRKALPLKNSDFAIYKDIHVYYFMKLRSFPNLQQPRNFNEKVQWLKLFDQRHDAIELCDKISAKRVITRLIGESYILKTLDRFGSRIAEKDIKDDRVYKCNHDSGSIFIGGIDNPENAVASLNRNVRKSFGAKSGEWAYSFIEPEIFSEEILSASEGNSRVADFKIYCVNGTPRFCHYIYDRDKSIPSEVLLDRKMRDVGVPLHPRFKYGSAPSAVTGWQEMLDISEVISNGFKMMRVDLYNVGGEIYFGETTFWPQTGTYFGKGQEYWGRKLDFSLDPRETIV